MPLDALPLNALYRAVTPAPVARLEDYRLPDWERLPNGSRIPRSSLTPILRFADVEVMVQEAAPGPGGRQELAALVQVGVAKEDQPHYLRVLCRPEHDPTDLIAYGLAVIGDRSGEASRRRGHGSRVPRGPDRGPDLRIPARPAPRGRRVPGGLPRVRCCSRRRSCASPSRPSCRHPSVDHR